MDNRERMAEKILEKIFVKTRNEKLGETSKGDGGLFGRAFKVCYLTCDEPYVGDEGQCPLLSPLPLLCLLLASSLYVPLCSPSPLLAGAEHLSAAGHLASGLYSK